MFKRFMARLSSLMGVILLLLAPAVRISPFLSRVQAAAPPAPETVFTLLAAGENSAVTTETSNNATTLNNGTEWYYTPSYGSMGFAPEGAEINQNSADINAENSDDPTSAKRLSWHTNSGNLESGYRAGSNTGLYDTWNRYVYQANTLPSYYPSGPQVNVSKSSIAGWTLCYQGTYAESISLDSLFASCSGQYLMYAASPNNGQKLDVRQNGDSLLYSVGDSFNQEKKVYPGSTVSIRLFESDGITPVSWNSYRAYISNCNSQDCEPNNPFSDPINWDSGTVVSGIYTIPSGAQDKSIVFYPADDLTGQAVIGNYAKILITEAPTVHTISNCDQLMSMDTEYGDGSEKHTYILSNDIDCSSVVAPEPLSWNLDFSGILDGQGYSITGLSLIDEHEVGNYALIKATNGATIKNITLNDSQIESNYHVGSFVGYANQTTFSNVHSSASIMSTGSYSYFGGIVGEAEESTIINSSATGNVHADKNSAEYVGGLAGAVWDSEVVYSYATGSVEGSYSVGGLVGEAGGSLIKYSLATGAIASDVNYGSGTGGFIGRNSNGTEILESYATGSVEGYTRVGGFAGANGGYIENSYARGSVVGDDNVGGFAGRCGNEIFNSYSTGAVIGNSNTGGFLGRSQGCSVSNSYWDSETSGQGDSTKGDPKTTEELKTLETFTDWDFDTVWILDPATNDGYPSHIRLGEDGDFDNIPNISEELAPNNGDADADGIADKFQENVTSLPNAADGQYVALKTDCGTGTANKEVTVIKEDATKSDAAYNYQKGLVGFKTNCPVSGATATVTLYFYGVKSIDGLVLRKFNPVTGAYTNLIDATLSIETIAGRSVLKAIYQITDGGILDQDGVADGTITDPVGLASLVVAVPNTGL